MRPLVLASVCLGLYLSVGCGTQSDGTAEKIPDAGVPSNFCFSRPKLQFCEDFDLQALPAGFDGMVEEGGQWQLEDVVSTSSPRAARVHTTRAEARVVLHKSFGPSEMYKTFLQFRIEDRPANGDAELLAFELSSSQRLVLKVGPGNEVWLAEGETRLGQTQLTGTDWVSVRFDILKGTSGRVVTLRLGEETVLFKKPLTFVSEPEAPEVSVGVVSRGQPGWAVRYDTVTVITQ